MGLFNDLTGTSFNRLTALYRVANHGSHTMWKALCDCGVLLDVRAQHLRNGNTKSCGCWDREATSKRNTTHGLYGTASHRSWAAMIQRCTNSENTEYANYGGRGIRVCARWRKFEMFFKDMGPRPDGKTLDRINGNGNYTPSNCRWATPSEQARNRRPKL